MKTYISNDFVKFDFPIPDDFVKFIIKNKSKTEWLIFSGTVSGVKVDVKLFNTWLQVYSVNYLNDPNSMGRLVRDLVSDLEGPFTRRYVDGLPVILDHQKSMTRLIDKGIL